MKPPTGRLTTITTDRWEPMVAFYSEQLALRDLGGDSEFQHFRDSPKKAEIFLSQGDQPRLHPLGVIHLFMISPKEDLAKFHVHLTSRGIGATLREECVSLSDPDGNLIEIHPSA